MIELKNVSFHYGGEHGTGEGVDNLNLTIQSGELVVLCGPSGCGKTTITRLINGLAPHFFPGELEGEVWVDGLCVSTAPLSETSRLVGSVFQNPKSQFFNVDSTGELVFGCENQGMEREEMRRRLDKTVSDMKLQNLLGRNIFELSGGEKQQIACGSVYTAQPEVYVLDEPSSNLDRKAITRLHETIRRIKDAGKTVVVSEHRLYYLMDLADRFLYLDDGITTRCFTPDELRALPGAELSALGLRCTDLHMLTKSPMIGEIPHGGKPVLETVDLSCNRGNHQILDIDRMSFPAHSIIAMIGDNGCGKSTLTESLCGVIPSSGSVAFDGVYLSDKERARRSFLVMQDVNRQLFSDSVIEEVLLNAPVAREEAEQVLESLGLKEQMDRHPASLSGGQKQRVAIASALCAGKEILFYDEPTSGLDRGGMERFGALLLKMRDKVTSVIITHDPELILQCCIHVLHVENGRVLGFYPLNDEGAQRMRWYFLSESEESSSKRREKLGMFGKVLQYAGHFKKYTYWAVAFMILGAVCSTVPYLNVYSLIDRLLRGEPMSFTAALPAIGSVLAFGVLYAITYTVGLQLSHRAAYHTLENLRVSLQEKSERQPLGNVQELGTGAVKKLFNDDIESIELMLAHVIPEGIANLTVPAVILLVLVAVDWQMALLTVIMLLFGFAASRQMYTVGMDRMGSYGQSMGAEMGMELLFQLKKSGIEVGAAFFDGGPFLHFPKFVSRFLGNKFKTVVGNLRGKTLEEALREPTIVKFSGGKPERYSNMLGPICQNAAYMNDETLEREADACVTFDYPAMGRDFQKRLTFFYSREESVWRFCHRKLKKAYPYAKYKLVSGYGHVGYPGEHLEEYCAWLSAAARGERLFTT